VISTLEIGFLRLHAYNAGPHRVAKWQKEADPNWDLSEFLEGIPTVKLVNT